MEKLKLMWEKLKREYRTFVVSLMITGVGAWQLAVEWGASLPNLLNWVPEQYKSLALFGVGMALLTLRKYTPTTVVDPTPVPVPEEPKTE